MSAPLASAHAAPDSLRLRVVHETRYRYASPVTLSRQLLHLTPRPLPSQQVIAHRIAVQPPPAESIAGHDYFGNPTSQAVITTPHRALSVLAESTVELRSRTVAQDPGSIGWEAARDALSRLGSAAALDAARFRFESPHVPLGGAIQTYAADIFAPRRALLPALAELTARIHEEFEFDATATDIATPLEEVLQHRHGVCQDFAHLMIGCLRSRGLAARYVSGYILTMPPPGQPRLIGADASHAWVSVYCPGHDPAADDWIDFDPTNNCSIDRDHATLGWGRDFSDVTPARGVTLGGGPQQLSVQVTVSPDDSGPH